MQGKQGKQGKQRDRECMECKESRESRKSKESRESRDAGNLESGLKGGRSKGGDPPPDELKRIEFSKKKEEKTFSTPRQRRGRIQSVPGSRTEWRAS